MCGAFVASSRTVNVPQTVLKESLSDPRPAPVKFKVNDLPSPDSHLVAKPRKNTLLRHGRLLPGRLAPKGSAAV